MARDVGDELGARRGFDWAAAGRPHRQAMSAAPAQEGKRMRCSNRKGRLLIH
jgi:hypothetical protein